MGDSKRFNKPVIAIFDHTVHIWPCHTLSNSIPLSFLKFVLLSDFEMMSDAQVNVFSNTLSVKTWNMDKD